MSPLSVEKQRRLKPSPKGEGWMRGNKSLDFILLTPAQHPAGQSLCRYLYLRRGLLRTKVI